MKAVIIKAFTRNGTPVAAEYELIVLLQPPFFPPPEILGRPTPIPLRNTGSTKIWKGCCTPLEVPIGFDRTGYWQVGGELRYNGTFGGFQNRGGDGKPYGSP
jgi:hypothetical protein